MTFVRAVPLLDDLQPLVDLATQRRAGEVTIESDDDLARLLDGAGADEQFVVRLHASPSSSSDVSWSVSLKTGRGLPISWRTLNGSPSACLLRRASTSC